MATPDFVLALRAKIGTDPLWLPGAIAVVCKDDLVLMVRRSDTGAWTPVTGIIDPGEQPASAAVRETLEETGVVAVPIRLASVDVSGEVVYPNGDRTQFVDLTFRLEWVSGEPHPADGENTEARWFPRGALPEMTDEMRARVDAGLSDESSARFGTSSPI
ncbi:MAG: NUDIX domain-containing protein [Propionibacteriales bacterium]|nr:NUDIX domain-containing protein [Propionibacteriales bacterium]